MGVAGRQGAGIKSIDCMCCVAMTIPPTGAPLNDIPTPPTTPTYLPTAAADGQFLERAEEGGVAHDEVEGVDGVVVEGSADGAGGGGGGGGEGDGACEWKGKGWSLVIGGGDATIFYAHRAPPHR